MKFLKALEKWPVFLFLLCLLVIALVYNFHHILFLKPIGIHQWRSCVSAAFPVNLAYGGSFFTTQTNANLADNFTSDITVVEFPLIYFIISIFYRVFGVNEFWFRGIQVVIGFIGLVYLLKASYFFTRDWIYAAFIPLIFFTSPVFTFYLSGFIPDSVALSLTFGGFYFFLKFSENKRRRTWFISMAFFLLAGLTKTSSLLPFFGLAGCALIERLSRKEKGGSASLVPVNSLSIYSFFGVLLLIVGWYLYAKLYSNAHEGSVSAVEIRPIWILDRETIQITFTNMKIWFHKGSYHATWFLILSGVIFIVTLFFSRKANSFLYRLNILVFLGALAFTILFFKSMRNHDYYQINNFFIFIPIYLGFFSILAKQFPRLYKSPLTKLALLLVVVLLTINCRNIFDFRYSERDMNYISSSQALEMYDIEDYLDEIGLDRSKLVHCTPDRSINISLYLCNRKGITDFKYLKNLTLQERIPLLKEYGIEYVILGSGEHFKDENYEALLGDKVGETGGTQIFKIK